MSSSAQKASAAVKAAAAEGSRAPAWSRSGAASARAALRSPSSSTLSSRPCLGSSPSPTANMPRLFSSLSHLRRAVPATSSTFSQASNPEAEADARQLRALFDSPATRHPPAPTASPTGLFLSPSLTSPESFLLLASRTLKRATLLVSRIVNAPQHGHAEMQRVVRNLDRLSDLLCGVIDAAELVRNAHPDPKWAQAANEAYEYLCGYMNILNTHTGLYEVLSRVLSDPSLSSSLTPEAHAVALVFLRDFEKSGIHLPGAARERFVELSDEILVLGRAFLQEAGGNGEENHAADSADGVDIPVEWLDGMPSNIVAVLKASPGAAKGKATVRLGRNSWEAQTVAKFGVDERARKAAYVVMSSGTQEQVNILETLLKRRAELAKLVGHESFAEMALTDKMAKRPENVDGFLRALAQHHRPRAQSNLDQLRALKQSFAGGKSSGLPPFYAWDRDYFAERYMRQEVFSKAAVPISPFFSIGTVLSGLSRVFSSLFGIRLRAAPVGRGEVWNDEVVKMEVVEDGKGVGGSPAVIGTIYADLYTRPGKPPSAAHYTVRCSRRTDDDDELGDFRFGQLDDGSKLTPEQGEREAALLEVPTSEAIDRPGRYQLPVVVLMCDFVRPTASQGSTLLSWHEVETLFHEMGHAIHSMIGRTEYHNVSGTRCATDFVELPSILMEHFVSSPSVIDLVARHHSTDAPLPYAHLASHLNAARSLDSLDTHNQILLASLDQLYHSSLASEPSFDTTAELRRLHDSLGVIPGVEGVRWQTQFSHLFGYGATYYSYLFDRAIASRIFKRLFAQDPLSREAGEAYKKGILAHGGGRDPWALLADVLEDEELERGDQRAMRAVGQWGIDT